MPAKYELISDQLRGLIASGKLRPGDRVPGEAALVEQYKVSPPTVRQALAVLRAEGLIEAKHGIGTFVRTPRVKARRTDERYQWEKNRVHEPDSVRRATGATEHDTGLTLPDLAFSARYTILDASEDLADAFNVPVGTRLLQRDYRTHPRGEDAPFSLSRSYLVYDTAKENPELLDESNEPWPGGTQHQLFTIGIEISKIVEEIEARPPTAHEADELGIPIEGSAIFDLRKISIDTNGHVAEVADVVLPGDRTQLVYTTHLAKWVERPSK